jgi:hypothetical protein
MAALFPRWSDSALRVGVAVLVCGAAVLMIGPMIYARTPFSEHRGFPVDQPVQFDHRHHVRDDGIDCTYCHSLAERAATAGLPATETCMGCHAQVWRSSPMLEPVRRAYFSGRPIPWKRVHRLPDFVYFDHSAHVTKGVGCAECHGRVDQMAYVEQVAPLTMAWCLDCHRDPAPRLRPRAAETDMAWQPPAGGEERRALAARLAAETQVQSFTNCTTCHR